MNIPEYENLMSPALQLLVAEGGELAFWELLNKLHQTLELSDQELGETLPSGRETVFSNRLKWALTYLTSAGQIESPLPDIYTVTSLGMNAIDVAEEGPEFEAGYPTSPQHLANPGFSENPVAGMSVDRSAYERELRSQATFPTPQMNEEHVRRFCEFRHQTEKKNLIVRVHQQSPEFFENLVIDLLLAMGYARRRESLVLKLGRSGDGGVDGVLQEDELGLSRIYFQAKRYKPGVAVPISSIRDFAGSLDSRKANRGLFLTTSRFPKSALDFVSSISKRIVLIDGNELAQLMMRHEVGVKVSAVYEFRGIDETYFSPEPASKPPAKE